MSELKIEMQQKTSGGYDKLYPKTTSSQVATENANTPASTLSGIEPYLAYKQYKTYNGGGTYGQANQNSITFDFIPKLVYIYQLSGDNLTGSTNGFVIIDKLSSSDKQYGYYYQGDYGIPNNKAFASFNSGTKTLSWYSTDGYNAQFNASGATYGVLAIG